MNKTDLLDILVSEYKQTIRLPNDISLNDYREAIEHETGVRMSYTRAVKALNSIKGLTSLLVVDKGKVTRVWRALPEREPDVETRNSHQPTSKRTKRVSKKRNSSELTRSVSI